MPSERTPSNFVEIPKDLFTRMILALELLTKEQLEELEDSLLLEDCDQWYPYEAEDVLSQGIQNSWRGNNE